MADRRHLLATLVLGAAFVAAFYLVYGGASWLTGLCGWRWRVDFPFEAAVPFVPAASLAYLSLPLMFLGTPWILRSWRQTVPLVLTLLAETLVAGALFVLVPVETGFPARVATGPFADVFRLADALNLEHNEVPSLHVAFAVTAAFVFGRGAGRRVRAAWAAWAAVVVASTLLIHEHHLVDLAAGALLAAAALSLVHRRCRRDAFLDALRLEAICLGELVRFSSRHARYAVLSLVLYRHALGRWRRSRILRAAYCLAQHVDDVLDGDRRIENPDAHVERLIRLIRDGGEPASPIEHLACHVATVLDKDFDRGLKAELLALFEVLRRDRRRLDGRLVWSADELAAHHRRTFELSLDLTLVLLGSRLRAADAGSLVDALAWCSPHRDLEDDLERGLVNVPREVVERVRSGDDGAVDEWIRDEAARGQAALAASRRLLGELDEADPGTRAVALFTAAIERWARRHESARRRRGVRIPLALAEPKPCRSAA